jgi:anaerobic dimethyl sulfoxide reductase subunit C
MGETALIIFTLAFQAAIGTLIFITLGKKLYSDKTFKVSALIAAVLSVIGVIASLMHLGRPLSALNSLSNLGKSWLSNEVFLAGAFMGIAVVYAYVQYFKSENQGLNTAIRWIGSIVGILSVFSMAKVYTLSIVPAWQSANTFVDFFTTTIAVGALIFLVTNFKELKETHIRIVAFSILASVVIQVAVAVPYAFALGQSGMAAQASAAILSSMGMIIGLKWLLILGGAGLLLWPAVQKVAKNEAKSSANMIYIAGAALIVGEVIGRYVFYAARVASNVGLT